MLYFFTERVMITAPINENQGVAGMRKTNLFTCNATYGKTPQGSLLHIALAMLLCLMIPMGMAAPCSPVAKPQAVVVNKDVRITILTPRVLRMEWAEDAKFEDHASLVFINRSTEVPPYQYAQKDGFLEIKTECLSLRYKINSGKFTPDNLAIDIHTGGMKTSWRFGDVDDKNLLGTTRTLDGFDGDWNIHTQHKLELEQGIISRSGWAAIDDSDSPLFDNSDWPWVMARPEGRRQDIYFLGYGYDYRAAMKDFTTVAGSIALPPRFAFGTWWSRYWNYDDRQLRDIVEQFDCYDLGLDVLVIDMDWHITSKPQWYDEQGRKKQDPAGQSYGWTGFTWNKNYFPAPEKLLRWTDDKHIKTCLNLHPASGIQPHEEKYQTMAKALNINPETNEYVPFDIVNKDFAKAYMNLLLRPMEKQGIDFWWLDWQQWSTTNIEGVNPTFYLNYVHYSDMERQGGNRPLIFHRWGGLGNHRYQIGFSGDTQITWKSLAYQPYFTATAANVGFGFWSHDIGGHYGGVLTNAELYTRWIQWGVFSPIFRIHAAASRDIEKRPWAFPMEYFKAMRDACHLRYALIPYIYTAARQAYDTGISICRPMYYDWPQQENAYGFTNEYMFGDSLLINPITEPIHEGKKYVLQKTWLPQGEWFEYNSGELFSGPAIIERPFTLGEIPIYVRAGTILPLSPGMKNTQEEPADPLVLNIFPGKGGKACVYEDEGNNRNFQKDRFAFWDVLFDRDTDKTEITIKPAAGKYDNMPKKRRYQVRLINTFAPGSVRIDGKNIPYSDDEISDNRWNYDGTEVTTVIRIGKQSVNREIKIVVEHSDADTKALAGIKGRLKRLRDFIDNAGNRPEPLYQFESIVHTAMAGARMTYNPSTATQEAAAFNENYQTSLETIKTLSDKYAYWKPYLELMQLN
jgi:alpha-glucosidase (family GH31 glycosyl hydrolase)